MEAPSNWVMRGQFNKDTVDIARGQNLEKPARDNAVLWSQRRWGTFAASEPRRQGEGVTGSPCRGSWWRGCLVVAEGLAKTMVQGTRLRGIHSLISGLVPPVGQTQLEAREKGALWAFREADMGGEWGTGRSSTLVCLGQGTFCGQAGPVPGNGDSWFP